MSPLTYTEIEPGVAFEYAVIRDGVRIGRVRKEEGKTPPYLPTGRWIADNGTQQRAGFGSREAAGNWLVTWLAQR